MPIQSRSSISLATLVGLVATAGCPYTFVREDHCLNQDGDAYCQRKFGEDAPFCGVYECVDRLPDYNNEGCVPDKPAEPECWSPCGDQMSSVEDDSCLDGVADDSSTSADSGDPTGDPDTSAGTVGETESGDEDTTTGVPACDGNDDCVDEGAPFCGEAGECVACDQLSDGDAACAEKFTDLGICNAGACVQCTDQNASACSGTSPICDVGTFSCGPCTAHEQCAGSEACNISAGSCFPEASVVTVDGDGPADYTSIGSALADRDDPELLIVLHELNLEAAYQGALTIENRAVAIFAAEGESPVLQGTGSSPGLLVESGATVYLKGIDFRGNTSGRGVDIDNASAYIERCAIVQNTGGGLAVSNDGYLRLVNCFVGQDATSTASVQVNSGADVDILYTTMLSAFGSGSRAVTCSGQGEVAIRNSIAATLSDQSEITCPGAVVTYSATETVAGAGNELLGQADETDFSTWFGAGFTNGDFSLQPAAASTFDDIARWRTGDPSTDIDGTPRPDTDNEPDYAGADRLN